MGLRMKNFIIGFHRKIRIIGGGEGFKKTIYRGNFLKRGARTVFRFKGGGLAKTGWGGWGWGGLIPQCTL